MSTIRGAEAISGVYAANVTMEDGASGCTVIVCPEGATGGVDVRGGAPATRETDLLRPEETVNVLHAVVLSGGSAYGLATSCGVAEELERRGIGLDVGVGVVPIVSSACLFDLMVGDPKVRPSATEGAEAVRVALDEKSTLSSGNVGAGCGCSVGKLAGPDHAMKAGLGQAVAHEGPLACAAISAVNAAGNVRDPETGAWIAGITDDAGEHVVSPAAAISNIAAGAARLSFRTNTTISCVVTNARLTKADATKVAQMAADAYAHAIWPTHTTNDGDTVFVMATGEVDMPIDVVGATATVALEQAIADAARSAKGAYGLKAACDLA